MMQRRSFLVAAGAVLAAAAAGATVRVYRVASLNISTRTSPQFRAMERRFRELGYIEGKNFVLDARVLGGDWNKAQGHADELARGRPDVAIAFGSEAILRAFRRAMGATPIVMVAVDFDPVDKNYIASLARPGGNITGVYFRQIEAAVKRVELLAEALPSARRVAALFDHSSRDQMQAAAGAAHQLGITMLPHEVKGPPYDIEGAVAASASAGAQALMLFSSGVFFPTRDKWIGAASQRKLPVVANPNYADAGALVSFGANFAHMYVRAAEYADRILKGAKPAEMPVEQPTQYDLIINLKTARALGTTIPLAVLARATRLID